MSLFRLAFTPHMSFQVAVVSFSSGVTVPTGDSNHDCYKDTLSFASKTNIDKLQEFVSLYIQESNTGNSNFENVLVKAFSYLGSTNNNVDVSTRGKYKAIIVQKSDTTNVVTWVLQDNTVQVGKEA